MTLFYAFSLNLCAVICLAVALALWRRPRLLGLSSLGWTAAALGLMIIGVAYELSTDTLAEKVFWFRIQILATSIFPGAWLYFSLRYSGRVRTLGEIWFLGLGPLLLNILIWTNSRHQLLWQIDPFTSVTPGQLLPASFSPLLFIHLAYCYILWVFGILNFVPAVYKTRQRRIVVTLILFALIISSIVDWLELDTYRQPDRFVISPFVFTLAILTVLWMVKDLWYFNLAPVARSLVIEEMRDGLLVLNAADRVVDLNRSACRILNVDEGRVIGRLAHDVFPDWHNLVDESTTPLNIIKARPGMREITIDKGSTRETFDLRVTTLRDENRRRLGRLVVWYDVTQRKTIEEQLRRQLDEISILHTIAQACVEAMDVDTLIDRATRVIGESLYTDNFGILLLENGKLHFHPSYHGLPDHFKQTVIPLGQGITGAVAATGQPQLIRDTEQEPAFLRLTETPRSELCVPLVIDTRVIGVVNVQNRAPNAFTEQDQRLLLTIAGQLALGIERLRAAEAEKEGRKLAEVLRETGAVLSATLELDQVFDRLLEGVARLAPYDAAGIMLVENGWAYKVHTRNYEFFGVEIGPLASTFRFNIAETPNLKAIVETRQPWFTGDIHAEPEWLKRATWKYFHSWCGCPVAVDGEVAAIFELIKAEPHFYTPEHVHSLQVFAGQAGLAMQNARLFEEKRRRLREVVLLSQVITYTSTADDLPSALNPVCEAIARFFGAPQSGFAIIEPGGYQARVVAEYQEPGRASVLGRIIPLEDNASIEEILAKRQPLIIYNAQNNPLLERVKHLMEIRQVDTLLLAPILLKGEVAGTLGVDFEEERTFTPQDLELMKNVTNQIGQSLERVQLFAAARQRAERMARLAQLSGDLNRPQTEQEVIAGIAQGSLSLSQADRGAIFIRTDEDRFTCVWQSGLSQKYINRVHNELLAIPGGQLLSQTGPILIEDLHLLGENHRIRQMAEEEGYRALAIWPMVYEERTVAALSCYYDQPHQWGTDDQDMMMGFARQATVALENARLFVETRRRAAQQEALNAIIVTGVLAPEIKSMLTNVLELLTKALEADCGAASIGIQFATWNLDRDTAEASAQAIPADLFNQTTVIHDWQSVSTNHLYLAAELALRLNIRASISVPVYAGDKRTGWLHLASVEARQWSAEEIALVETVGRQIGSAAERLELLAQMQTQARQMQQIMDTVPEGVLVLNDRHQIIHLNPAAGEYLTALSGSTELGECLEALANQPIQTLLSPAAHNTWQEVHAQDRIFEVTARNFEGDSGGRGWVLVLREVTQERESQKRVQIQERLATVGQLAAGIAHDFNNIMAAVVVYADLLSLEPSLSPASRDRLAIIQQQVQRATSLIRQILDFSRRSVMEQDELDLLPFIKELGKLLGRVLPENIRLEIKYKPAIYLVRADPTRLQQAFMNLALNARDAMPQGGLLCFSLDRVQVQFEDPSGADDLGPGDWIHLQVFDTGDGIAPEILPRIFDPFFTTKPVGRGTGLGLAQVYGIIKQHSGSITVHSQEGQGTIFDIFLPALITTALQSIEKPTLEPRSGAGWNVLVVEDDEAARTALTALLESQNYQVNIARDGIQALEIFEADPQSIDLIVSDVVMPNMGGIQLHQELIQRWPRVKFLFVTGHPLTPGDQTILEKGRVHWLMKPFTLAEFNRAIQELIKQ